MICNSCGGDIAKTDQKCKYCGADNPNYVMDVPVSPQPMANPSSPATSYSPTQKTGINWGIFVLLLLIFWPAAIIYAIAKSVQK